MSQLGGLILDGLRAGAGSVNDAASLALHMQALDEQRKRAAAEQANRDALLAIQQAEEDRRRQQFNTSVHQEQAAQGFLSGQMSPYLAQSSFAPNGHLIENSPDAFFNAGDQYLGAQDQFAQMDPRIQSAELARRRQEQKQDQTYEWARRGGMRVSDLGETHREGYMEYLSRNGFDPITGEFDRRATPYQQAQMTRANPFVGVDPDVLSFHLQTVQDPSADPADIAASQAWLASKTGKVSTPYAIQQHGRQEIQDDRQAGQKEMVDYKKKSAQLSPEEVESQASEMVKLMPEVSMDRARAFVRARHDRLVNEEAANVSGIPRGRGLTQQQKDAEAGLREDISRAERLATYWDKRAANAKTDDEHKDFATRADDARLSALDVQSKLSRMIDERSRTAPAPKQSAPAGPVAIGAAPASPAPSPVVDPAKAQAALMRATKELGPGTSREAIKARARELLGSQP